MRGGTLNALLIQSFTSRRSRKARARVQYASKMPHSVDQKESSVRIVPVVHTKEKSNVKFAAEVYGVDLNNFSGKAEYLEV